MGQDQWWDGFSHFPNSVDQPGNNSLSDEFIWVFQSGRCSRRITESEQKARARGIMPQQNKGLIHSCAILTSSSTLGAGICFLPFPCFPSFFSTWLNAIKMFYI